ncbi:MAG: uridylate kinase [Methylovirgula sp.]
MSAPKTPPPIVVKIGGSLAGAKDLGAWIAALDRCPLPLIVVPGGGPFADAVRAAQAKMHFDDEAAHHMALVAMQQYGIALAALWPRLAGASTPSAIRRALRLGQVPCWNPSAMAAAAPLPKGWDITSDTLAAWLAGTLKSDRLLLIKSVDVPAGVETAADLAAAGIVDPLFPHYAAASGAAVNLAGPAALAEAATLLAQGILPGHRLRLA